MFPSPKHDPCDVILSLMMEATVLPLLLLFFSYALAIFLFSYMVPTCMSCIQHVDSPLPPGGRFLTSFVSGALADLVSLVVYTPSEVLSQRLQVATHQKMFGNTRIPPKMYLWAMPSTAQAQERHGRQKTMMYML